MVKGPNKKTSLSKLKEKKSITNEKKKTLHVTSFFLKKVKDKSQMANLNCWPVIYITWYREEKYLIVSDCYGGVKWTAAQQLALTFGSRGQAAHTTWLVAM